jgi:predicted nuclease of restriction endonuclease-like (RecB) superfamily
LLIRVEDPVARTWYMQEAASQNWSVRALDRQIHSLYYQRLLSSRNKRPVIAEMLDQTAALAPSPHDFIRDPVVLEFLDLPVGTASLRESRLEQAIIGRLQHFLLELGKGFAFVARQQRVSTETKDFFIDLVFYNYILKCFVLIDLKVGTNEAITKALVSKGALPPEHHTEVTLHFSPPRLPIGL